MAVQVLGKAKPRAYAAAALEHLNAWLEQQSMSLSGLTELAGPEPDAAINRYQCLIISIIRRWGVPQLTTDPFPFLWKGSGLNKL